VPTVWLMRPVCRRTITVVAVATLCVVLAGCGHQARLNTQQVVDAARAAGFQKVRVFTYGKGIASIPTSLVHALGVSRASLRVSRNGSDYVIPAAAPYLWLVRMPNRTSAISSARGGNYERGNGFVIRARRVCNIVLIDWAPGLARAERAAVRVVAELHRRCR
jgi:hypothetical protein